MKTILTSIFILISSFLYSQEQKNFATYTFPIGTKFTLELVSTDSDDFKYRVLSMEPIDYSIDYSKKENLFNPNPIPGTIECIFAKGVDQEGPSKSVLILRNNSKVIISYEAEISYDQSGKIYSTSVEPLFPNAKQSELWNDHLTYIVIHSLSKAKEF
jgi:hypothetical protein